MGALEAVYPGDPGVGPQEDQRSDGGGWPEAVVGAGRRRHTRADRGDGGVRGQDARARRSDHDLDRRVRSAAQGQVGRPPRACHPDQRSERVHADGLRRLARRLGERGLYPPRIAGRDCVSRDGPLRRDRLAAGSPGYHGSRPFDAENTWPITTRPSPAGSRKFGWALSRMMCGWMWTWTRVVPRNVSSSVMPSIVGSDQVWSNTKLPSAYQMGLPL